jgi:hypothetical protein
MNQIPRRDNENIKNFLQNYFKTIKTTKEDDCCGICLNNYCDDDIITSLNCQAVLKLQNHRV